MRDFLQMHVPPFFFGTDAICVLEALQNFQALNRDRPNSSLSQAMPHIQGQVILHVQSFGHVLVDIRAQCNYYDSLNSIQNAYGTVPVYPMSFVKGHFNQ